MDIVFIIFLFVLGTCVGSFLNVVVWRVPRGLSLVTPPSHCPKCEHRLAWYDNIPVLGWILLRGKCRYCQAGISSRYPIIEAVTGLLLVFYYVMFFMAHVGPCAPVVDPPTMILPGIWQPAEHRQLVDLATDWPMYGLYAFLICSLLAVSLIDAETFSIPLEIPWLVAVVGILVHALADTPKTPGALSLVDSAGWATPSAALAAGSALGLVASLLLLWCKLLPVSFPDGEPSLEVDEDIYQAEVQQAKKEGREPPKPPVKYSISQIRGEIRKEMMFLLPPLMCGMAWLLITRQFQAIGDWWQGIARINWVSGMLGAMLGAMVGGLVVWVARIFGTLGFGRVAMGLGDVHLMFGVGAVVGAGAATVAFFLAPFAGLIVGIYGFVTRRRRELPLGPYLSLATAAVMLCYCPIARYLSPGLEGLGIAVRNLFTPS